MTTTGEFTERMFKKIAVDPTNRLVYRNQIVEANIKLVSHVLKKYKPYTEDNYQHGCIGLILAVDTFNDDRGVPFSSYACFLIERELRKAFARTKDTIEHLLANQFIYLDSSTNLGNGEEISLAESIPCILAEEEFQNILDQYVLGDFFQDYIEPSVTAVANNSGAQKTKVDRQEWVKLEMCYILELVVSDVESQKRRLNLQTMAKLLGVSVQNIRNKHMSVLARVQQEYKRKGGTLSDD